MLRFQPARLNLLSDRKNDMWVGWGVVTVAAEVIDAILTLSSSIQSTKVVISLSFQRSQDGKIIDKSILGLESEVYR